MHALFLYKNTDGKFGSIGINKTDYVLPTMKTVESLSEKVARESGMGTLVDYEVFDLGAVSPDFIDNDRNNSLMKWF